MTNDKQAGWMTGAVVGILLAAALEAIMGFLLALFFLVGMAVYSNSKSKKGKIFRYVLLGLVMAVLCGAAIYDLNQVGISEGWLDIGVLAASLGIVGMGVWLEKKSNRAIK